MKVKKLTEESMQKLIDSIPSNDELRSSSYFNHTTEFIPLTDGCEVHQGHIEIDNSELDNYNQVCLETDGKGTYDFENSVRVYEMFPDLPPGAEGANDARFWSFLTHNQFHKYTVERWMSNLSSEKPDERVKERFFMIGDGQGKRLRNAVARLWWIAHLTVQLDEENFDSKWKYTKAICGDSEMVVQMLDRTIGCYPNIRYGVLDYFINHENTFRGKVIQKVLRDINNIGGVRPLGILSRKDVYDLVSELESRYLS